MRLPRFPHRSLVVVSLAVLSLVTAGSALALRPAGKGSTPSAGHAAPKLTADTDAPCNATPRKGYARCFAVVRTPAPGEIVPSDAGPPASALGPADISAAYRLPSTGGGQTVAVVDAFGDSHAEDDLAVFRAQYGLPSCTTANGCFRKVDQNGASTYPADDAGWALETSLDLDAVSAACPACNILLVEGTDNGLDSLADAVDTAVELGAKFVSNSYGASPEDPSMLGIDQHYSHQGVVVAVSTGDVGNQVNWPSSNPNVVAVGGTTLTKDGSTQRGWSETAWSDGGSGCSAIEPKPDYQNGVTTDCTNRATADISADADPATGLATYDTLGQSGWLQVGGTSLAAPLVTSMYALAGPPQPGTYPVTYPYHDAHPSTDLNDVTSGSDGPCGNVLCTAGPGWDGPTGVGTPNGVAALTSGPHGTLAGTVTDSSTSQPVTGATLTANPGGYATRTDGTGHYHLDLPPGTYDLSAAHFGYQTATRTGIVVAADQTTTDDLTLTAAPANDLTGTVTDGSGHGWALHASITVPGDPDSPFYTDPATGRFDIHLPQGSYDITVATSYPGYATATRAVTIGSAPVRADIALTADLQSCTAPGYGWDGASTDFTGWSGSRAEQGWTVSGTRTGWRFDNPGDRPPPEQPGTYISGGDDNFAVADSGTSPDVVDSTLTSPRLDLSGQHNPQLQVQSEYYASARADATIQLSTDGGRHWSTLWRRTSTNQVGLIAIPIPSAAGHADVRVRFRYAGRGGNYWAIDNVFAGAPTCVARPGGLLVGVVHDAATGAAINGAQVAGSGRLTGAWPEGVALGTTDPALAAGFYWLFSPAGRWSVTSTAQGYRTDVHTVDVTASGVTRHDVALTHGS